MTQQDINNFISISKDFLCELDSYVHMEYEQYGNGKQYPVIDEEELIAHFEKYIREKLSPQNEKTGTNT